MLDKRKLGKTFLIAAVVLFVASIGADYVGLATNPDVFGELQITGIVVSVVAAIVGWILKAKS